MTENENDPTKKLQEVCEILQNTAVDDAMNILLTMTTYIIDTTSHPEKYQHNADTFAEMLKDNLASDLYIPTQH